MAKLEPIQRSPILRRKAPVSEKLKNLVALARNNIKRDAENPDAAVVEMKIGKTAKNMKSFAKSILEDVRNRDTEGLFMLESGNCSIRNAHDNHLLYSMKPGDIFGEHALY